MEPIIALDFGNCYSFPCYIPELDISVSRLGGKPVDLLPSDMHYGYPSVFFYSRRAAERCRKNGKQLPPWCGADAVKAKASPESNRVRNLKRHLGEPLVLDDWKVSYDDAIVQLIQYLMRRANEVLRTEALVTTHRLALYHPATYTLSQRTHLKNLAERATLEDGTHIQVVGMIDEPAAAALDYLVENGRGDRDTTVLAYDLGGGTFDLAIVSAYPQGRTSAAGNPYYYRVEKTGGISSLGGSDFDEVMLQLLKARIPASKPVDEDSLRRLAETAKLELSRDTDTEQEIYTKSGEVLFVTVTRQEFEKAALPLVQSTVEETRQMLKEYSGKQPELLVLTGGASQMPMVQRELEKAFPQFKGHICLYRPSRAIAYGAARYNTPLEENCVQRCVSRDIGIRYYHGNSDKKYVETYIPAGAELPFASAYDTSTTRGPDVQFSYFAVMEAKVSQPDQEAPDRDYTEILSVTLDHGRPVPQGTPSEARLVLDQNGLLSVEARDPSRPDKPPVQNSCTLKNLS